MQPGERAEGRQHAQARREVEAGQPQPVEGRAVQHGGRVQVDRGKHVATLDGQVLDLTAKEFDLLAVLAEEPGRAVPRQELFSRVWDPVWIGTGKTLDVHVASLRKKLGDPDLIETVRGVGYRLAETQG